MSNEHYSRYILLWTKKTQKNPEKTPKKTRKKPKKKTQKNPNICSVLEKTPKKPQIDHVLSLKKPQVEFGVFSLFWDFGDPAARTVSIPVFLAVQSTKKEAVLSCGQAAEEINPTRMCNRERPGRDACLIIRKPRLYSPVLLWILPKWAAGVVQPDQGAINLSPKRYLSWPCPRRSPF